MKHSAQVAITQNPIAMKLPSAPDNLAIRMVARSVGLLRDGALKSALPLPAEQAKAAAARHRSLSAKNEEKG